MAVGEYVIGRAGGVFQAQHRHTASGQGLYSFSVASETYGPRDLTPPVVLAADPVAMANPANVLEEYQEEHEAVFPEGHTEVGNDFAEPSVQNGAVSRTTGLPSRNFNVEGVEKEFEKGTRVNWGVRFDTDIRSSQLYRARPGQPWQDPELDGWFVWWNVTGISLPKARAKLSGWEITCETFNIALPSVDPEE